ncbi:hypothetical protein BDN70DRAFT_659576 [Pholiota conissans]|uniref:Uncharacterized protein n=1 Tax=Pholiota conissans TaxID=109636 RepID=A0A9P6CU05_9AGAR|nr:hypothetical protein BDN70DRAFT_659576 [Pholiota conissans]
MIQDIMIPPEGGPVPPNRIDALESFLHVLNWIVLRHGRHDLPKHRVEMYLTYLFEFIYGDKEGDVEFIPGRTHKKNFMTMCSIRNVGLEKGPFLELLEEFTKTCAARYLNGVTKSGLRICLPSSLTIPGGRRILSLRGKRARL